MKRNFDAEGSSDNEVQQAEIPNQQSRSDALRSSSDTPEHLESASNTKNSLATSFAQQDSVLTAEQIESLKGFDKEGVGIVLDKIARDACRGHPGALNAISQGLASCTKEELIGIFQISYNTLHHIAHAAGKGHPDALNAISTKLRSFTKKELIGIFQASPHTLNEIAHSAGIGYPDALNAISGQLASFSKEELEGIFQRSPHTLDNITCAAWKGHPDATNAISTKLRSFTKEELKGIFQASSHTLDNISWAACEGHPDALNAISRQFENFCKDELKTIFTKKTDTLGKIALAACKGYPDALNAISVPLANFNLAELLTSLSSYSMENIASAAGQGHTDAFHAILSPLVGVMDLKKRAWSDYCWCLSNAIKPYIFKKPNNRFLGLERAFCNLDKTTFSRITNRASSKIISQLEKSINWYKEFSVIFNQSSSDQLDMSRAEFHVQENLSARVRQFVNDSVLQRDQDQTSRDSRIAFIHGLCDYLTMMDHHHLVLDLNKICLTYQSGTTGLNGYYSSGYTDSVLHEFSSALAQPSGTSSVLHEFSRTLAQPSVTSFFQASPASPESDAERDKRYEKAYDMLKSFNANLGLWIQFDRGRDPLSAQKTVVEHFKLFLRAYLNALGDRNINNDIDYDDVNKVLKEKDWNAFVDCRARFFVNELADTATSSGSFQPSSHRP